MEKYGLLSLNYHQIPTLSVPLNVLGGGFPRGPFPPQHRFPQQGINNPFMMRQPRPSWQNPGGPGINRSLMNMEMIPSKPFMAVKPMMSQDFGLSHQGNDQMGTIKPLLPQVNYCFVKDRSTV